MKTPPPVICAFLDGQWIRHKVASCENPETEDYLHVMWQGSHPYDGKPVLVSGFGSRMVGPNIVVEILQNPDEWEISGQQTCKDCQRELKTPDDCPPEMKFFFQPASRCAECAAKVLQEVNAQ